MLVALALASVAVTGCAGTEARLSECPWLRFGHHNCGHHEDVGVTCIVRQR